MTDATGTSAAKYLRRIGERVRANERWALDQAIADQERKLAKMRAKREAMR